MPDKVKSPISPSLAALKKELENGNSTALDNFWDKAAQTGTPLIEPLENNPEMQLVTFLWRSNESLENVVLGSPLTMYDVERGRMQLLPGSDLWYLSLQVKSDLRTTYHFSLNDPLTSFIHDKDIFNRFARMKIDPLNALRMDFPEDNEDPGRPSFSYSILELPKAAAQPWCKPRSDVPAGKVEMHHLRSEILGNERRVWLYFPPGYDPVGEPYPLLVVFDGLAYLNINTPALLDNLLAEGLAPPFVAILPNSGTQEMRSLELPCHAPFTEFLVQELLPWAHKQMNITTDPDRTFLAGSSYGGLAAVFAAFQHPERFGNVISQSGSYWWKPEEDKEYEWLTQQFVQAPHKPVRFYLDVGTLETLIISEHIPTQLIANRHFRNVLLAKGYKVNYTEYSGGHDYVWWQSTLADGLLALLAMQNSEN